MASRRASNRQAGFTLLEAVLVIVLTGIVGAFVAVFLRAPIDAYLDQSRRAELSDAADGALRRITRELQAALPNSVRVGTSKQIQFMPVRSAGRYRAAPKADGSGDWLDFGSATDHSFEVLGPPVEVAAGDSLVIYNLGLPGADAYSGESRRALNSIGGALTTLDYAVGAAQFPFASPSQRFQVVSAAVTFSCADGSLRRNGTLLAMQADCSFAYTGGGSARNALVTATLTLGNGGESVTLLTQVHLDNAP